MHKFYINGLRAIILQRSKDNAGCVFIPDVRHPAVAIHQFVICVFKHKVTFYLKDAGNDNKALKTKWFRYIRGT